MQERRTRFSAVGVGVGRDSSDLAPAILFSHPDSFARESPFSIDSIQFKSDPLEFCTALEWCGVAGVDEVVVLQALLA